MKYKILLAGKNKVILDDFFTQLYEQFEILTSSSHYVDIMNHLKYFKPDMLVYCLNQENNEFYNQMIHVKVRLKTNEIPFCVIGDEPDCDDFMRYTVNMANLVLTRPITATAIEKRIGTYLREQERIREQEEEEKRKEQQRREEEARQKEMEEAQRREEEEAAKRAQEKAAVDADPNRRRHVLVVDDDPLMLKMIKDHLHESYDVATAPSGKIALKFLEKKTTDLILLDYEMPVENGPAVLEKLHANSATKDIPVVFLTGVTEKEKIQNALVQKPQGYLLKPIDHDKLMDVIQKQIG